MTRQEAIQEIAKPLVDFCRLGGICLSGSGSRGESGPDRDLGFLAAVRDDTPAACHRGAPTPLAVRCRGGRTDRSPG